MVVVRSALFNVASGVINTSGDGVSRFQATLLSRAVNTVVDHGRAPAPATHVGRATASTGAAAVGAPRPPTDLSQLAMVVYGGRRVPTQPPAAAVDAIPIGEAGCSLTAVDLYGNPRGVDGNGDGIPGCDIGAYERQP